MVGADAMISSQSWPGNCEYSESPTARARIFTPPQWTATELSVAAEGIVTVEQATERSVRVHRAHFNGVVEVDAVTVAARDGDTLGKRRVAGARHLATTERSIAAVDGANEHSVGPVAPVLARRIHIPIIKRESQVGGTCCRARAGAPVDRSVGCDQADAHRVEDVHALAPTTARPFAIDVDPIRRDHRKPEQIAEIALQSILSAGGQRPVGRIDRTEIDAKIVPHIGVGAGGIERHVLRLVEAGVGGDAVRQRAVVGYGAH